MGLFKKRQKLNPDDILVTDVRFNKLVRDLNTNIVYVQVYNSAGITYCPYYSANGYLCRLENGELVEIKNH